MCGYDPFRWSDNFESEEEYIKELEMTNKVEIDLDAISARRIKLMDMKARYDFKLKQISKEIETLDLQLIALLSQTGVEEMDCGTFNFGWKTSTKTALDQKYLKENYREVFDACYLPKENRTFQFKLGTKKEQ